MSIYGEGGSYYIVGGWMSQGVMSCINELEPFIIYERAV